MPVYSKSDDEGNSNYSLKYYSHRNEAYAYYRPKWTQRNELVSEILSKIPLIPTETAILIVIEFTRLIRETQKNAIIF